ncbi:ABC transporter permease subunit [Paenibacillus sp. J5C_2022]|uniref:ABC transporter permease n=1 Tax=Paenibacillus sp. J5C2022 TaxID=2977129 RepID=UPI0021D00308|nr:ABC transporter permease subunit [Paenibacillus sp. J5C2022]MCU6711385.1 ABC transporter permease subunit [Paenibacillus sp. J5C2022]
MSNFIGLVRNENMKIYRRPRTWVLIAVLLMSVALMSGVMKWEENRTDQIGWEQRVSGYVEELQQYIAEKEDIGEEERTMLENEIKLNQYYLEHDRNPFALTHWEYVQNSAGIIILVTLLTVIIAADMVAAEFTWGTIKLLLVGPASRTKILLSKYAVTLTFALMLLLLCFASAYLAGGILEGFSSASEPRVTVDASGIVQEGSMLAHALQTYGYSVVSLVMYVTMAFMISAAFRSSSMAIAFSLLFMLLGSTLSALLSKFEWSKYLLFSNIDLTNYLEGGTPLRPEMTLSFSITMLLLYYVVFQVTAWLLFTRRDVAA